MKKFSLLVLLFFLVACNKDKNNVENECRALDSVAPFLVGKWQLTTRKCDHWNSTNCQGVGVNFYPVSIFPTDDMIEILRDGTINIYKDGIKVQTFLASGWVTTVPNSGRLIINCGDNSFFFSTLDYDDTLSLAEIGSVIEITNQHIDLNFKNYPVVSKCGRQEFEKIE